MEFLQDTQTSHAIQITSHAGFSRKDREKSRIITYSIQGSDQTDLEISPQWSLWRSLISKRMKEWWDILEIS